MVYEHGKGGVTVHCWVIHPNVRLKFGNRDGILVKRSQVSLEVFCWEGSFYVGASL